MVANCRGSLSLVLVIAPWIDIIERCRFDDSFPVLKAALGRKLPSRRGSKRPEADVQLATDLNWPCQTDR